MAKEKVTTKPKRCKAAAGTMGVVDFSTLQVGDVFLFADEKAKGTGDLYMVIDEKGDDLERLAVNLETGITLEYLCDEEVIKQNMVVTYSNA